MWGWRLTGCWGFAVRELPLGASRPTVSEQGAAAQRGSGKATNAQDKTKHRDDWDLFYFELTLFLKHCCRVTSWFFVWLKLRQRFQLSVDFVSFDLFWISIPVCLHALCVRLWKSSSVCFFCFFVRGEGGCFVRPISVFYNIIAILIDLFCCLNYSFLFYQFKEYIICIEISPTGIQNQMQIILFNIKTFKKSVICLKNCSKMQSGSLLLKF